MTSIIWKTKEPELRISPTFFSAQGNEPLFLQIHFSQLQVFYFYGIGQKTIVADFAKTIRYDVQTEAPQKLPAL